MIYAHFSPQRSDKKVQYRFEGEELTISYRGIEEELDFSEYPEDGMFEEIEMEELNFNPIREAYRENGDLYITLMRYHDKNAPEEVRFPPEWEEIEEGVTYGSD